MDEEPVEILAGMAERGEIDPWNVDIVDVTDRFLAELDRRKELDLRVSGRTLFYAACLLRLKSEYLEGWSEEEDDEPALDEEEDGFPGIDFDFGTDDGTEPIERLEREIQRRLGRKSLRKRPPVTLYELIKQLKTAEKEQRRRHPPALPAALLLLRRLQLFDQLVQGDRRPFPEVFAPQTALNLALQAVYGLGPVIGAEVEVDARKPVLLLIESRLIVFLLVPPLEVLRLQAQQARGVKERPP